MAKTDKVWKCYSVSPKIDDKREELLLDLGGKFGKLNMGNVLFSSSSAL